MLSLLVSSTLLLISKLLQNREECAPWSPWTPLTPWREAGGISWGRNTRYDIKFLVMIGKKCCNIQNEFRPFLSNAGHCVHSKLQHLLSRFFSTGVENRRGEDHRADQCWDRWWGQGIMSSKGRFGAPNLMILVEIGSWRDRNLKIWPKSSTSRW